MREYQLSIARRRKTGIFVAFTPKPQANATQKIYINFLSTRSIMQELSTRWTAAKEHIVHFLIDKR
jgi:hypothetical protein